MDVRYHFVREYLENDEVKVIFVKSEENTADIYTKNLGSEVFIKHIGNIMDGYLPHLKHRKGVENIFFKMEEMNREIVMIDK